jgi:hypothetical protein
VVGGRVITVEAGTALETDASTPSTGSLPAFSPQAAARTMPAASQVSRPEVARAAMAAPYRTVRSWAIAVDEPVPSLP